jgi:hypothetical protein
VDACVLGCSAKSGTPSCSAPGPYEVAQQAPSTHLATSIFANFRLHITRLLRPTNLPDQHPSILDAFTTAIMPDVIDPRMMSVQPRIRYNTIGGINGPLVVLDNVRCLV